MLSTTTRGLFPAYPDPRMRPKFLMGWIVPFAGNYFRIESMISAGFAHFIYRTDPKRCMFMRCVRRDDLKNFECPPTTALGRV